MKTQISATKLRKNALILLAALCTFGFLLNFALDSNLEVSDREPELVQHEEYERKIVGPMNHDWILVAKRILDIKSSVGVLRYGDGELAVIEKQPLVSEQDNWKYNGGPNSVLSQDLSSTLSGHYGEPLYYCFPTDDNVGSLNSFMALTEQNLNYISYANLFVNANYKSTKKLLSKIQEGEAGDVVIFASKESKQHADTFKTLKEYVECPDHGLEWYESNHQEIKLVWDRLAMEYTNTLFILSCGPLSNIAVHRMWNINKNNRYIDIGSAVDEVLKGRQTRLYMNEDSHYAKQMDSAFKVVDGKANLLQNYF
ncbi:hypothetical protein HDV06_005856 [Boothiomyces sp. JEL0866]|nr:hypothetical protein HDV06_005856 [Boothiomyces sp. JEL0866]